MRISDWSSDVCSSDLEGKALPLLRCPPDPMRRDPAHVDRQDHQQDQRDRQRDALGQRVHGALGLALVDQRSEEHTSELQSLMRISYAVFCLKKKTHKTDSRNQTTAKQKTSQQ